MTNSETAKNSPARPTRLASTLRRVAETAVERTGAAHSVGDRIRSRFTAGASAPVASDLYAAVPGDQSEVFEPLVRAEAADELPGLLAAYAEIRAHGDRIFSGGDISSEQRTGALAALCDAQHALAERINSAEPTTAAGAAALIEFGIFQLADDLSLDEALAPEGVETLQRVIALLKSA